MRKVRDPNMGLHRALYDYVHMCPDRTPKEIRRSPMVTAYIESRGYRRQTVSPYLHVMAKCDILIRADQPGSNPTYRINPERHFSLGMIRRLDRHYHKHGSVAGFDPELEWECMEFEGIENQIANLMARHGKITILNAVESVSDWYPDDPPDVQ